jgi:DNA-binding CsgD family transcriptional regulator
MAALRAQRPAPPGPNLTPRERECLKWVAAGKTDWEISQILNISEQTAHGYVQNALIKLGARTRAQAVAQALLSAQLPP